MVLSFEGSHATLNTVQVPDPTIVELMKDGPTDGWVNSLNHFETVDL